MSSRVLVQLQLSPPQLAALQALQRAFAQACNALAPLVRDTRCWSRVALHHMAYKRLREQFPTLGSQMVCNAIYSVSRAARLVYQHRASPFNLHHLGERTLPLLEFTDSAPVYFDRHTLSLKGGVLSLFTLDGRIRMDAQMSIEAEERLRMGRLREVVLSRQGAGYVLLFSVADGAEDELTLEDPEWPDYLLVTDGDRLPPQPLSAWTATAAGAGI